MLSSNAMWTEASINAALSAVTRGTSPVKWPLRHLSHFGGDLVVISVSTSVNERGREEGGGCAQIKGGDNIWRGRGGGPCNEPELRAGIELMPLIGLRTALLI